MEKFKKLNLCNKILIILLVIMSFNFICPTVSNADMGGTLLEPVTNLLTSLGDGIIDVVHSFVMGQEQSILHSSSNRWQVFLGILAGIATVALAIVLTAGLGLPALSMGAVLLTATGVGVFAYNALPSDRISLPMYSISPEAIFKGEIALVDINFFNPEANVKNYEQTYTRGEDVTDINLYELTCFNYNNLEIEKVTKTQNLTTYEIYNFKFNYNGEKYQVSKFNKDFYSGKPCIYVYKINDNKSHENIAKYIEGTDFEKDKIDDKLCDVLADYNTYIRDEEFLDKNGKQEGDRWVVTSEGEKYTYRLVISNYGEENEERTLYTTYKYTVTSGKLQSTIATWYVTLRNIALVISMSILVYVGIRMMLTSIAAEKAKYKNMLFDWLVGVGLILVMHYIMVFAVNMNDQVLSFVSNITKVPKYESAIRIKDDEGKENKKLIEMLDEYEKMTGAEVTITEDGYVGFETSLMGNARLLLQNNRDESVAYVGYAIMFLVLVFYTVAFLFVYLKRVLYMAFLTIVAPLVAMTYPLDKLTDGKAQAFNMWVKEYIMNLLIQPVHLFLYYVLISSAIDLATQNVLYSLVAIGFLLPAEKIIRKFFGLDKAQTPGFLNGAAGAALAMSAVGSLKRFGSTGNESADSSSQNRDGSIRSKSRSLIDVSELGFGPTQDAISQAVKNEEVRQKKAGAVVAHQIKEEIEELETKVEQAQSDQAYKTNKTIQATQQIQEEQNEKLKFNILGAVGGLGRHALNGAARFTGKIPGLAVRGFGAATLGAVGLAAGIATGDPKNALKYALTGGTAGSAVAGGLANRAINEMENLSDDMFRGAYGEEYDQYLNQKADKLFFANKENQDFYRAEFGSDFKKRMVDAIDYRERGITDNNIIAKAMNLPDKFGGKSKKSKEKLYIAQLASQITSRSELARTRESLLNRNIAVSKVDLIEEGVRIIKKWN